MRVQPRAVGLAIAGLGLLLLGLMGGYLLLTRESNPALQATDFSAVPSLVLYHAPELSLTGLDGASHSLADYRGQVVLVNLWATWCPPCKAEMPLLQKYFDKHKAEGFSVIAIEDGDPEGDVRTFVSTNALTFPVWLDPTYQASDHAFKTINLPTSYVIDRTGNVRLMWVGAINEANLEKYVTPIVREK